MEPIKNAQVTWNKSATPISDLFDDVYYSPTDGVAESRYVFLEQNQLQERWLSYPKDRFVIAETGFGTGLNFLVVWYQFELFLKQFPNSPLKHLHFISFEQYPLTKEDLINAHAQWPELATQAKELHQYYPIELPECQRLILKNGIVTLDLWYGDVTRCIQTLPSHEIKAINQRQDKTLISNDENQHLYHKARIVDAWFLDGFSPHKNPSMWTEALFSAMAALCKPDATFSTFTAASVVRRGLSHAGFMVEKRPGFGKKREMLRGVYQPSVPKSPAISMTAPVIAKQPTSLGKKAPEKIAIIGGGIAGICLALSLERRGIKSSLYCQDEQLAMGASSNQQGAIYPLLNQEHNGYSRFFAPAFTFARQFYQQMTEQFTFEHQWCGVNLLLCDQQKTKQLSGYQQANFPDQLLCFLNSDQTNHHIGIAVDCPSIFFPLGGWINPQEFIQNAAVWLTNKGALELYCQSKVTQLLPQKSATSSTAACQSWQLDVEHSVSKIKRSQHYDKIIIATGSGFEKLYQTKHLPLSKVKGQVTYVPTNLDLNQLKTVICAKGYLTPQNQTMLHTLGASYERVTDGKSACMIQKEDGLITAGSIDLANKEKLCHSLSGQKWPTNININEAYSNQGIRAVSRDHLAFIGALSLSATDKATSNLYTLIGLGSRGLCSAPLLAEIVVSELLNQPIPIPSDLLAKLSCNRRWRKQLTLTDKNLNQKSKRDQ